MANLLSTKIALRTDTQQNWNMLSDQVLLNGEVAIVMTDENLPLFKIGDGVHKFYELPYSTEKISSDVIHATDIVANSICQGVASTAVPQGIAAGMNVHSDAIFSQAFGNSATSKDLYSFAWNGKPDQDSAHPYETHGIGTFNVNPKDGLSGFYVGEKTLQCHLDEATRQQDYTSFEVFPTKQPIPAGSIDSNDKSDARSVARIFGFDNVTATGLTYIVQAPAADTLHLQFKTSSAKQDCNIIIDWGDSSQQAVRSSDVVFSYDENEHVYEFNISHQYMSSQKFIVKIFGKDYSLVRSDTSYESIISRVFDKDLSLADCLQNVSSLVGQENGDLSSKRILNVNAYYGYNFKGLSNFVKLFMNCTNLQIVYWALDWMSKDVLSCHRMFKGCSNLQHLYYFRIPGREVNIDAYQHMFYGCSNLEARIEDILPRDGFRSKVVNVNSMFYNCRKLTGTVPARLLWKDTATTFQKYSTMFAGCSDEILSQVPASWGGTDPAIVTHDLQNDYIEAITNGIECTAAGRSSHAEGKTATASGLYSHAENEGTSALVRDSHAEGYKTTVSLSGSNDGIAGHAEGNATIVYGNSAHAEGVQSIAAAKGSHAEGYGTQTNGQYSHAEGYGTAANALYSHAEGVYSESNANDRGSFVWNGDRLNFNASHKYPSHGEGTFNVNPAANLSGFYIGDSNLKQILQNETKLLNGYTYDLQQNGEFTRLVVDIATALGAVVQNCPCDTKIPLVVQDGEQQKYGDAQ